MQSVLFRARAVGDFLQMTIPNEANGETLAHRAERRVSAASSLKEMILILAAISITNALASFAPTMLREGDVFSDNQAVLCLLLLVLSVVRFYHGNIRLLDDTYGFESEGGQRGGINVTNRNASIALDFLFMFTIALLFALSSFFIRQSTIFVCILLFIVFVDVMWHLTTMVNTADTKSFKATKRWFINNFLHLLLGILATVYVLVTNDARTYSLLYESSLFLLLYLILLVNTLFDFFLSYRFYFPAAKL